MSRQKQKFDDILQLYFEEDTQTLLTELGKLPLWERELFWSYANTRIILRKDSLALANVFLKFLNPHV